MAAGQGIFAYFKTKAGQKLVLAGATVTTLVLSTGNFLPQTIFIENYSKIFQLYKSGEKVEIPSKLNNRLEIAFEKLQLPAHERFLIKAFSVVGFDIYPFGSTKYRFGCALGIPKNFSYDTIADIDRKDIRFRDEPINWSSESGKLLQSSLVLTQDEQIFGICKAILQMQTHWILMNSIFPSASFLFVYTIGNFLNQKLNLLARPISIRLVMYSILGCFGLGVWSFMKDFNQVKYDAEIDEKLSKLGPEFIDAGVRYYEKVLNKNIAMRHLMGNDHYTALGNENYMLRQKSLPITMRKLYFEARKKEMEENVELQQ